MKLDRTFVAPLFAAVALATNAWHASPAHAAAAAQPTCDQIAKATTQQLDQMAAQMGKTQLQAAAASCLGTTLTGYSQTGAQMTSAVQQVNSNFKWGGSRYNTAIDAAAVSPVLDNFKTTHDGAQALLNKAGKLLSNDDKEALRDTIDNTSTGLASLPSMKQVATTAVNEAKDQMSAEQLVGVAQSVCAGESITSQLRSQAGWLSGAPVVTDADQRADVVFQKLVAQKVPNASQYQASFNEAKGAFCKAVNVLAQLYARIAAYQDCVKNGYVLASFSRTEDHHAAGKTRHSTINGALTYKCGTVKALATGGTIQDEVLSWNSTFKWSDESPRALNIIKSIRDASTDQSACDKVKLCIPISDRASMCMGVKDATSTSATILLGAKIRWEGQNKTHCLPAVTVPSLGYLAELEQMGASQKQALADQLKNQLVSLIKSALPMDQQTIALLDALYQASR
jgi:hypothetical protein